MVGLNFIKSAAGQIELIGKGGIGEAPLERAPGNAGRSEIGLAADAVAPNRRERIVALRRRDGDAYQGTAGRAEWTGDAGLVRAGVSGLGAGNDEGGSGRAREVGSAVLPLESERGRAGRRDRERNRIALQDSLVGRLGDDLWRHGSRPELDTFEDLVHAGSGQRRHA